METCTMWNKMIEIMKQDIKPATGCTEPISLAFAAATAAKELGEPVQAVKAFVSANLMKFGRVSLMILNVIYGVWDALYMS